MDLRFVSIHVSSVLLKLGVVVVEDMLLCMLGRMIKSAEEQILLEHITFLRMLFRSVLVSLVCKKNVHIVLHSHKHYRLTLLRFYQGQLASIERSSNIIVRMFAHDI